MAIKISPEAFRDIFLDEERDAEALKKYKIEQARIKLERERLALEKDKEARTRTRTKPEPERRGRTGEALLAAVMLFGLVADALMFLILCLA